MSFAATVTVVWLVRWLMAVAHQRRSPSHGVLCPGSDCSPATIRGPYEPLVRRRKRSCVSGVPTITTRGSVARLRASGMYCELAGWEVREVQVREV